MEVEYDRSGEIAFIHLNRPERLNAVTAALTDQLGGALARAAEEDARVVVLAGRGRAFCAGHDLKEPEPVETPVQTRRRLEAIQE
ncbi:enoyl-CoA hydratase-related protein, partial [Nocardioides hankookensis]